jgi:bacillolysin
MMSRILITTAFLSVALGSAFAQNSLRQAARNNTSNDNGLLKAFVTLQQPVALAKTAVKNPTEIARILDLDVKSSVEVLNVETDQIGDEHIRLQQTYLGFPIENSMYLLHTHNGAVTAMNGEMVATFPANLSAQRQVLISEKTALKAATDFIGASEYKWQLEEEEQFIKRESENAAASFYPKFNKVWISATEGIEPAKLRLAYKLDIYAHDPLSRDFVFVDAHTGAVIGKKGQLFHTDVPGTAVTAFSGTQTITTDLLNGSYRLREVARGLGIQTFNMKKGTNYASAVDFTDADNNWNNVNTTKDQYATDAHWGAEKTYDYFKNTYNRNSIDGNGFAIKNYIHYSTNYFNAFWDGTRMTYGDGDASNGNKPLTAIDVCGHEITHGLTSYTANLTYSNESGALNEGFSDVFGNTIEVFARPTQNSWLIGEDFYTIRSMSNPNAYQQPDTYQGTYWATGTADNGGVHTNSGVLNYWYYLLCAGGTGTNDKGTAFNVTSIGMTKAAAIAFRTLTIYLTPSSNYAACKTASLQSATDLYGAGSPEVTQVNNAWIAVGLGTTGGGTTACTDIYEANESLTAAKVIATNTAITAKISSSTDKDYFKFTTTTAAKNIKLTLTGLPADYDLKLYNSAGTQLAVSELSGTASESVTYNNGAVGTYYAYVYGYGGVNSATCYSLTANVSGTAFFGTEGGATEGDLVVLGNKNDAKTHNTLYPTPASTEFNIVYEATEAATVAINLYDISGKAVLTRIVTTNTGTNTFKVDLPVMASGLYFVRIGENSLQRLMIQQ